MQCLCDFVLVVEDDDGGVVGGVFLIGDVSEVHDDKFVAGCGEARAGSIDFNDSSAALAGKDIGFKPVCVVAVGYEHAVVGAHPYGIEDVFIDGYRAYVVVCCAGACGVVNLAVENFS